ncbi:MAG: MbnP family protein [Bacteroidales bacterium]
MMTSKICVFASWILMILGSLMYLSCQRSEIAEDGPTKATTLVVRFENLVDSLPLILDSLMYENSSGDFYEVTDLQYFISGLTLHRDDGYNYTVIDNAGVHYVDARIPESLFWTLSVSLPYGNFDSISFTFGIDEFGNYSNRFPNPPERDMNWPDVLGGGYHYMKMNLLWKKTGLFRTFPFNFHIGIGQIYKGNVIEPDSIIGFVQNYFNVNLPASAYSIEKGQIKHMVISMNVNQWFTGNNEFDFAKYPNTMMQHQTTMNNACLNGRKAFGVRFTSGP